MKSKSIWALEQTINTIILVRAPFINSWAVFNKRRRNVVATSSQRRRRSSQVVAGRRNVVAIKNGRSDLIINPRTASLDFGLFIFCSKILVVWRLKQNHPRLSGWGNLRRTARPARSRSGLAFTCAGLVPGAFFPKPPKPRCYEVFYTHRRGGST